MILPLDQPLWGFGFQNLWCHAIFRRISLSVWGWMSPKNHLLTCKCFLKCDKSLKNGFPDRFTPYIEIFIEKKNHVYIDFRQKNLKNSWNFNVGFLGKKWIFERFCSFFCCSKYQKRILRTILGLDTPGFQYAKWFGARHENGFFVWGGGYWPKIPKH